MTFGIDPRALSSGRLAERLCLGLHPLAVDRQVIREEGPQAGLVRELPPPVVCGDTLSPAYARVAIVAEVRSA